MQVNKEYIESVINKSEDLITALEAVGAMYGIPSSHILQDDSQQTIKVVNDTIIAPNRKNANANTQSIVCAIGSVLDYISQRVDDKLDNFQIDAINKDKLDTAKASSDPNKGKVIKRFETDDGDEILVYDSGIIDRPMTRSALMMVADLKRKGEIPEKIEDINKDVDGYFSDADDISMDTSAPETPEPVETNVSESVGIADSLLDVISEYNNTTYLGYDIFSEMGFDIKPTDSDFYQEAKAKKSKLINPKDIKHMKFDNKHILKAVKYFNEARAEQSNVKFAKDLDIKKFIDHPSYHKGVRELEEQFQCHISYKWMKDSDGYENAGTYVHTKEHAHLPQITISKSKGFQLHGAGIWIEVWNCGLFSDAPSDPKLFGQTMVAVTLHEIFHNIAWAIRGVTDSFIINTATTMSLLASARSVKRKREIANHYIDSIKDSGMIPRVNPIKRKILVKQLIFITSLQSKYDIKNVIDTNNMNDMSEADIDKTIEAYRKKVADIKRGYNQLKHPVAPLVTMFLGIIGGIVGLAAGAVELSIAGFFVGAIFGLTATAFSMASEELERALRAYQNGHAVEESWCDMFAGIYNFPTVFFIKNAKKGGDSFSPNVVNNVEKLNELAKVEKEAFNLMMITYPSNSERNHAAAKLAENALKQKGLDPATRKYLTWIKDNFSSMLSTDIENEDANTTYDPNRAGDVDKHIQDIINQGNVQVTESFV